MNKKLHITILFCAIICIQANAQRYLTEIFNSSQIIVDTNVTYGNNFSFLTFSPVASPLKMDIYAPDPNIDPGVKPLIIYMHTGSFLPAIVNGTPTGTKTDSATVEMCMQFARRGYVAAAISYRLGWNPVSGVQAIRTGTLLNAVYRSIQDAKACVRYFRKSATSNNPFNIDTNAIVLGGQGSGGYVALAYATLDKTAEINLVKFLSDTTIGPPYGYVQGQSYVNPTLSGDFDGYGGDPNYNNAGNSPGYSTKIHFVFNMGGALGDSSWLEAGDAPMVSFHVTHDPFAPFGNGPVFVPGGMFVVNASGSQYITSRAFALGNNNCFVNAGFTDPYTVRANQANFAPDGLFPFEMVPLVQAGPWEYFELQATRDYAVSLGYPPSQGDTVYTRALYTNPNMSKAKSLAYIDTIQNYLNPRIVYCLGLQTDINENSNVAASLQAIPNPSANDITIDLKQKDNQLISIKLMDLTGRTVAFKDGLNGSSCTIMRKGISPGMYIANVYTEKGFASIRIIFN